MNKNILNGQIRLKTAITLDRLESALETVRKVSLNFGTKMIILEQSFFVVLSLPDLKIETFEIITYYNIILVWPPT